MKNITNAANKMYSVKFVMANYVTSIFLILLKSLKLIIEIYTDILD